MSDSTPRFEHAPDASRGYWHNTPLNTLPPPDMVGNYQRFKPLPTEGIATRKAWIVGGGIAGLAAAFYLIRDGHMPAANITIIEGQSVEGGSLDGPGRTCRRWNCPRASACSTNTACSTIPIPTGRARG